MNNLATRTAQAEHKISSISAGNFYLETQSLVERLHRRLLDVITHELSKRGRSDINAVQALILYNIGDQEMSAGELRNRGCYLGSNVSYNLKKLVDLGFLDHERGKKDRRCVRIKITESGRSVSNLIDGLYKKHAETIRQVGGVDEDELLVLNKSLKRLERFWVDQVMYRL